MPFISFTTNQKFSLRQENEIVKRTGELITILPGKKEENLMLHIEDNQILYFRGTDVPCMMIEVKLYKNIEILVNYEPKMHYFTEWWKQLFGESEGKEQKGIFPAGVDFTTDLHSMGQYIQEGRRNLFFKRWRKIWLFGR